jgi:predicted porin
MARIAVAAATIFTLIGIAHATQALADENIVTKAAPAAKPASPTTCSNPWDFFATDCVLSWYGITVYGTVDFGVTWQSRGVPFNGTSAVGQEYLISKNSNRALWGQAPNGLSQSNIGIKGTEAFAPGWSFVFLLEAGFDPYSLQLANGPHSIAQNSGTPLDQQNANADSSRAGQFYNSQGYLGVSSPTYGTLTVFRQNSLTLDGVNAYDPMAGSYAFSVIGYQGTTCGVGNTEDCRFSTSLKYRVDIGQFRVGALWQFGGYNQNNASNGAYQLQFGGNIPNLAGGTLSLDAIGSFVKDAVGIANAGNTLPATLPQVLTATISDDTSVMLLGKYANGPLNLYGGYEWIRYAPPSDPQSFFTNIAGDFLCAGCAGFNNTNIVNTAFDAGDKTLHVFWTGAKYAVTPELNVIGAYYHYSQPTFGAPTNCAAGPTPANCSGTLDAFSFVVDWQFAKKFDAYAGLMYSQVNAGLANGYLHHGTVDPTVGLRFKF